jgi:hypothetical protein
MAPSPVQVQGVRSCCPMADHSTEGRINSRRGDGYGKEKAWVETTVIKVGSISPAWAGSLLILSLVN